MIFLERRVGDKYNFEIGRVVKFGNVVSIKDISRKSTLKDQLLFEQLYWVTLYQHRKGRQELSNSAN